MLEHFLVDEGLSKIAYVSPMNEPDNNFGPSPCGQEGMEVTQYQYVFGLPHRRGVHSRDTGAQR